MVMVMVIDDGDTVVVLVVPIIEHDTWWWMVMMMQLMVMRRGETNPRIVFSLDRVTRHQLLIGMDHSDHHCCCGMRSNRMVVVCCIYIGWCGNMWGWAGEWEGVVVVAIDCSCSSSFVLLQNCACCRKKDSGEMTKQSSTTGKNPLLHTKRWAIFQWVTMT